MLELEWVLSWLDGPHYSPSQYPIYQKPKNFTITSIRLDEMLTPTI